jgi:CDP-paratose 2-epimerase
VSGVRDCLITGGAGFIGANLADRLLATGHPVTVFDDCSRPGTAENLAWLRARHGDALREVRGDVADASAAAAVVRDADVVYHLAGQTAVTTSIADPRADFHANAAGTFNVLEAARASDRDPIVVYASTNKVYGDLAGVELVEQESRWAFRDLPGGVAEDQPLDLNSPYACSKGAGDQYALAYHRAYGLRTVVFRQSCIYGPRQLGHEEQGWLAWFVLAALRNEPLTIFGDGKQVRDVLHVDDLLDAYELAVAGIERTAGHAYNIGGGPRRSVSVWAELGPLLERAVGAGVEPAFGPWRPGDQRVFVCDTSAAARDLGWEPRIDVEPGLRLLVDSVRERLAAA